MLASSLSPELTNQAEKLLMRAKCVAFRVQGGAKDAGKHCCGVPSYVNEFWLEIPGPGRSCVQVQAMMEEMGSQFVREKLNPPLLLARNSEVKFRRTLWLFGVLNGSLSLNRI